MLSCYLLLAKLVQQVTHVQQQVFLAWLPVQLEPTLLLIRTDASIAGKVIIAQAH